MSNPMTPSQNWPGGSAAGRTSQGPILGVVFLVGFIGAVVGGVLTAIVIGFVTLVNSNLNSIFDYDYSEPEGIDVSWSAPALIELGSEFDLKLTVRNTGKDERRIVAIDVDGALLGGVEILSGDPAFHSREPAYGEGGFETVLYNEPLAPGDELSMTLRAKAINGGVFTGFVDVCIDERSSWKSLDVRFRIVEPGESQRD